MKKIPEASRYEKAKAALAAARDAKEGVVAKLRTVNARSREQHLEEAKAIEDVARAELEHFEAEHERRAELLELEAREGNVFATALLDLGRTLEGLADEAVTAEAAAVEAKRKLGVAVENAVAAQVALSSSREQRGEPAPSGVPAAIGAAFLVAATPGDEAARCDRIAQLLRFDRGTETLTPREIVLASLDERARVAVWHAAAVLSKRAALGRATETVNGLAAAIVEERAERQDREEDHAHRRAMQEAARSAASAVEDTAARTRRLAQATENREARASVLGDRHG